MSTQDPEPTTTDVETPDAADDDVQSDPSLGGDGEESEWASEGGAVDEGPATDTDAG